MEPAPRHDRDEMEQIVLQSDLRSISSLHREIEERETKIRRLFDSNIIGIVIWKLEGQVVDANNAFLRMVGYGHEDLVSGRVRWTDITPPEWRDRDALAAAELKGTGTVQPFEKEYFRKDGSRVPVLIGVASFDESGNQRVAFVLELTERKRAETEAREGDRRFREMQMDLARANRVDTLGQLTASIAHEVNQPLSATLMNAETALRLLAREPPDLEEARQVIDRIVNDGKRAVGIINRIRDLIKKAPACYDSVEINTTILDVIGLARSEMSKNGVSLQMRLAESLPLIQGDRIQIQQVILNLTINAVEAISQMGEGPRELLLSTEAEQGRVLVAIRDSGPGLAQANPERVFEAFYTTKSGGLGIGLSICRSIVEAHGGQLWTTPNEPRGAVFYFTLPIRGRQISLDGATQQRQGRSLLPLPQGKPA